MSVIEDTNLMDDSSEEVLSKCLLPELYASAEDFEKESKKCTIQKIHNMSLSEAQKLLSQNLHAMSLISDTDMRKEDPQPILMCTVVKKEDSEKPQSMTDLLHHTLQSGSLSTMHKLHRSQERILQSGIPPPKRTFPYELLMEYSKTLNTTATQKKDNNTLMLCKLSIPKPVSEKFIPEDKLLQHFSIKPEKQFMDLKDLEWRYYKGIVKWTRRTSDSFIKITYNREKRFVQTQQMPKDIFPPLVNKSLYIYPQDDFHKK